MEPYEHPNLRKLLSLQNQDGGWSYNRGGSWTEPTCYALLALSAVGLSVSKEAQRASRWLAARQRVDGGWAPHDVVPESAWVTSLLLLLPDGAISREQARRAVVWVLSQSGNESSFLFRLRMRLLGLTPPAEQEFEGWPWYPKTSGWVGPTSLSILALRKIGTLVDIRIAAETDRRIEQGRRYLLARRCRDGGWNHGSSKALGYDSDSYPETTGMALLALHDSGAPEVAAAETLARRQLERCRSCEGASWLQLALLARGSQPANVDLRDHQSTLELAMELITEAARRGRNVFIQRT